MPRLLKECVSLCVPTNESTIVQLDFSSFPEPPISQSQKLRGGSNLAVSLAEKVWYITLGDWYSWKWANLVSETAHDWSSYSTGKARQWRTQKKLVLGKKVDNSALIITLKALHLTKCQRFILAPWSDRTALYWDLEICPSSTQEPTSAITDDNPTFNGAPVTHHNGGRMGRIHIAKTDNLTKDDIFQMLTGISGQGNNWLLLAEQAANKVNSDCIVCMGARPTLRVVPAPVNSTCLLDLMNNTKKT